MNSIRIKVDIWSDFVCPFCYIGKRNFENGLKKFEHRDKVDIVYRSFQLRPDEKRNPNQSTYERLAEKYGMSIEKAKLRLASVAETAKNVGLDFNFDKMVISNTYDAHRLAHYAKYQNKLDEFIEQTMLEFFTNSQDISDTQTLVQIAVKAGLDEKASREVLTEGKYGDEVKRDRRDAAELRVSGVPYFLFGEKFEISGAQPPEMFTRALEKLWNEQNKSLKNGGGLKGGAQIADDDCADGSCKI